MEIRTQMGLALRIYRLLGLLSRRKLPCLVAIAAFTFGFRFLLSSVLPHPQPSSHDEFGYLLGADLLASGRTASAPHPMWKFLESLHVISWPVYASKFPPAQAAFLAAGLRLFGDPFYGVLLSVSLFSAAVYWMLQTYVRPPWALLGGICTALYFGAGHYWTETYWGGAVAGLGAALFIGSFGRLLNQVTLPVSLTFGIGALLLANSRPYESSLLVLFLLAFLLGDTWRRKRGAALRTLAPALASLVLALSLTLAYHYSVTGNPIKLPYQVYMDRYASAPQFWFQPLPEMKHYWNAAHKFTAERCEIANYEEFHSLTVGGSIMHNILLILGTLIFDGGILALVPLVFIPLFRHDHTIRRFALVTGLLLAAVTLEVVVFLHYLAPLIVAGILLSFLMLDRIWRYRNVRSRDRTLLVACLTAFMLAGPFWHLYGAITGGGSRLYRGVDFGRRRAHVAEAILSHPGRHVVLVRFNPKQNPDAPWVANGANIDGSRLIWAHDRGEENRELEQYYKGRTFWSLEDLGRTTNLSRINSLPVRFVTTAPPVPPPPAP